MTIIRSPSPEFKQPLGKAESNVENQDDLNLFPRVHPAITMPESVTEREHFVWDTILDDRFIKVLKRPAQCGSFEKIQEVLPSVFEYLSPRDTLSLAQTNFLVGSFVEETLRNPRIHESFVKNHAMDLFLTVGPISDLSDDLKKTERDLESGKEELNELEGQLGELENQTEERQELEDKKQFLEDFQNHLVNSQAIIRSSMDRCARDLMRLREQPVIINRLFIETSLSGSLNKIKRAVALMQCPNQMKSLRGESLQSFVWELGESITYAFGDQEHSIRAIKLISDSNRLQYCDVDALRALILASVYVCTGQEGKDCVEALLKSLQEQGLLTQEVLTSVVNNFQVGRRPFPECFLAFKSILEEMGLSLPAIPVRQVSLAGRVVQVIRDLKPIVSDIIMAPMFIIDGLTINHFNWMDNERVFLFQVMCAALLFFCCYQFLLIQQLTTVRDLANTTSSS